MRVRIKLKTIELKEKMMFSLLRRLWNKFKMSFVPIEELGNPMQPVHRTDSVKECTRDKSTRMRVSNAFKQQQSQMNARALKSHGSGCGDTLMCSQKACFKRDPDLIKGRKTVKRPITKSILRKVKND